ncbi:site-specific integrase [Actinomadura fulvescens]|uniref:Site-specific integrase n=1 Tax=Actinomadura fulvescens TaxID=46160 RepID=A0ABN3QHP4_9ACTN
MKVRVGKYKGSIYPEGNGWTGALDVGYLPDGRRERLKRRASSPDEVRAKLRRAVRDRDRKEQGWSLVERAVADFLTEIARVDRREPRTVDRTLLDRLVWTVEDLRRGTRAARYTVAQAVTEFLDALEKQGRAPATMTAYWGLVNHHVIPQLGATLVLELSADRVEEWLHDRAKVLSSSTLGVLHGLLKRTLRRAWRHDKATRNVAELVDTPKGQQPGRPSKSLTMEQAAALLSAAIYGRHRLGPYVVVGVTTGLRTEELRALRWDEVDLDAAVVYVVRSDRFGGDTKTSTSRRGLQLSQLAVEALRAVQAQQAVDRCELGDAHREHGLVFCRADGTPYTASQVQYWFRKITDAAGLGREFCPRELRHTFVSVLSDDQVSAEALADLVGHANITTTVTVYRHQIRPVVRTGAARMDRLFSGKIAAPAAPGRSCDDGPLPGALEEVGQASPH